MSIATAPRTAQITGWDRMVVIALGGAGCALSYDALQQMAVAIHVRGLLTYLFPLVIDGFIAYGIRALLVLRDAPLRARLYVWTLFGTATAASIWANALHAVRLNEEIPTAHGLRLGDTVVAVLSTIAPLALAGAVHLYILIARGAAHAIDQPGQTGQLDEGVLPKPVPVTRTDRPGHPEPPAGQVTGDEAVTSLTDRPRLPLDKGDSGSWSLTQASDQPGSGPSDTVRPGATETGPDQHGHPDTAPAVTDRLTDSEPVTGQPVTPNPVTDRPVTTRPVTEPGTPVTAARRPDPDTAELLEIAREAVEAEDKLTRKVVAQAIRGQQIPLSSDTLTALMIQLRQQHGQVATSSRT
ncbi:DUF2637 domain-containing protein [Streptantibioticus parmotrematis]|uniref:DUF2637 domain-containing protein n=1 Tax=Streptantibioticus parmotrematis TaxID=2873249 RepID=UPI0033E8F67F